MTYPTTHAGRRRHNQIATPANTRNASSSWRGGWGAWSVRPGAATLAVADACREEDRGALRHTAHDALQRGREQDRHDSGDGEGRTTHATQAADRVGAPGLLEQSSAVSMRISGTWLCADDGRREQEQAGAHNRRDLCRAGPS